MLKEKEIDLVVVDIDIFTDLSLLKHLKTYNVIVAVIGSENEPSFAQKIKNCGADMHLLRPITRDRYAANLRQLLQGNTRTMERVTLPGRVEYDFYGEQRQCGIVNISQSGILIQTQAKLTQDEIINLAIFLGNTPPLQIKAKIVRFCNGKTRKMHSVGAKFLNLTKQQLQVLQDYIDLYSITELENIYYQ